MNISYLLVCMLSKLDWKHVIPNCETYIINYMIECSGALKIVRWNISEFHNIVWTLMKTFQFNHDQIKVSIFFPPYMRPFIRRNFYVILSILIVINPSLSSYIQNLFLLLQVSLPVICSGQVYWCNNAFIN